MGPIEFKLPDGSTVGIERADMGRVYEILWDLSDKPGAISTAAALLHAGRQSAGFCQPVDLTAVQGEAIRQALDQFASPS